jgi:hypothetical protein
MNREKFSKSGDEKSAKFGNLGFAALPCERR